MTQSIRTIIQIGPLARLDGKCLEKRMLDAFWSCMDGAQRSHADRHRV
jgi:hypothetical protein